MISFPSEGWWFSISYIGHSVHGFCAVFHEFNPYYEFTQYFFRNVIAQMSI